jgi:hypothetical protein
MKENLTLSQAIEFSETIEGLEANLHGLHKPTQKEMGGRGINRVDEEEASVKKQQRCDRYMHNMPTATVKATTPPSRSSKKG